MSLGLAPPAARRRPSLTPMIDVVFLLLVFFMLAARMGAEVALPVAGGAGGTAEWSGPPRLVDIRPEALTLNGVETPLEGLAEALTPLVEDPAADPVVLRPRDGADLQRVIEVIETLSAAGYTQPILVE
ncbi:biopolymer transporter ExbD [Rhodovulum sp. BSW8]|uniref:Biopolymer transporter ExbD n=1 Tax=Rhodovulum visakhapatnamense TaxID=364297 RepID=A0ABS1RD56_9RHOB|nr:MULTISPECIES: biopolymer transporter ExbD [Rhodovulum]MBL3571142.1 biopolymer transporter ExbD [Rhodovulum visakhapatnamense]MBL3577577.1 biopolymer transporter ExbD [Rhodovulum visakhapatnamense]OLS46413.1 indolepyruvate ferredoxin oxidoreductase [Rhodovulum sulfidophilum]RBO52582.1 biopolymer transporter ExbD [Rhodovulum sp. BSW8]